MSPCRRLPSKIFLIVYIIRTKRIPFFRSLPSRAVVFSTLLVVLFAWCTPFTSLGHILSFIPLSGSLFISITGIVLVYLFVGEGVKWIFYHLNREAL